MSHQHDLCMSRLVKGHVYRYGKILRITDVRLADAAERFPITTRLKGFLKHELMR